ncbi:hypothetical protein Tco_1561430 [Tanacetum coccineum]
MLSQFLSTAKAKTINEETQIQALVDGKKTVITESSVRNDLQFVDEDGIDCLLNTTIFDNLKLMGEQIIAQLSHQPKKTHKPRNPKSNVTQISQSGEPIEPVTDEDVLKERGDSLERADITASSLEAEQVSANINKTQSKATLNKPNPQGIGLGSGLKRQDTIRDTIAQTGFKDMSKTSNDSLLAGVNTPQSDEDSMKLKELMDFCTKLQQRVLDLKNTKTAQA